MLPRHYMHSFNNYLADESELSGHLILQCKNCQILPLCVHVNRLEKSKYINKVILMPY